MKPEQKQTLLDTLKKNYENIPQGIASDVQDIAKYIVTKCTIDKKPTTNEQLQHIIFLLQKETLHYISMPIHRSVFEAWDIGPVVPEVYEMFEPKGVIKDMCKTEGDIQCKRFIDGIVEEVYEMHPMDLPKIVKKNGGAWHTTYHKFKGEKKEIPLYLIKTKG